MGLFGRLVNQVRNQVGLDTTADAMDRKINKVYQSEETNLKSQKEYLGSVIQSYQSDGKLSEMQLEIINRILNHYDKIKELAIQDICKASSGMTATIDGYKANYVSLKNYIEMINKMSKDILANVDRLNHLELEKENLIKKYIHAVLLHRNQDNGELAENMDITTLFQMIQIDTKSLPITVSNKEGYDFLEEVQNQCKNLKRSTDIKLSEMQASANPYYSQNAQVEAKLSDINRQRAMLRNTKEYISKDSDRRAMRK